MNALLLYSQDWALSSFWVCTYLNNRPWVLRDSDEGAARGSLFAGLPGMGEFLPWQKPSLFQTYLSRPGPPSLGQWSQAPALLVMCGVVGRKNQIMKLVSLLGLQAPSSQSHRIWLYSRASFSLTTNTVPCVSSKSANLVRLMLTPAVFNFPFATFSWDCQTGMTPHVLWLKFGVLSEISFLFFQTHEVWPLWAGKLLC